MKNWSRFWTEEDGVGIIEIILILLVTWIWTTNLDMGTGLWL